MCFFQHFICNVWILCHIIFFLLFPFLLFVIFVMFGCYIKERKKKLRNEGEVWIVRRKWEKKMRWVKGDPYPRQYLKELQPCNYFNPNHPINLTIPPFDNSPKIENTTLPLKLFQYPKRFPLPLKLFQYPKRFPSAIYTIFQIPHTLSPPHPSFSILLKTPFSLSHPRTMLVHQQITPPLRWRTGPHLIGKI